MGLYDEVGVPADEVRLPTRAEGRSMEEEIRRWNDVGPRYGLEVVGPAIPAWSPAGGLPRLAPPHAPGHNAVMVEQSAWMQQVAADPEHSSWYVERFRSMAAAGDDLAGEARLVDAMARRVSRILDAGCGPGRVGAALAAAGHDVVGVDVDPELIEAAEADHPGPRWILQDLAELDLRAHGITEPFDLVVGAGNVMTFLAPSTRGEVLRRLRAHVHDEGRVVTGFGANRGYEFSEFLADAEQAGLRPDLLLSTWDLRPWDEDSDFLVAVLRPG